MSNKNFKKFSFSCLFKKNKNLNLHEPSFDSQEIKDIKTCIKKKNVSTSGSLTKIFEKKISSIIKCKHVIATNSGTSALHLALITLGIQKGDEVLMPSLNYIASANACLYLEAKPHFVDVDAETLGVDPKSLNEYLLKNTFLNNGKCINKKTKNQIKSIICLHTFGHPCKIIEIIKVCRKFNLSIIEDAAEALGSYYKKRHVGNFGDIGILSFNGNKIITTGGGGAILTNNYKYAKKILNLATIYKKKHPWKYEYDNLGYNYRMPSLNSAIGLSQIKKLKNFVTKKRLLYRIYEKKISKFKLFQLFKEPIDCKSNYWLQTVILKNDNIRLRNQIIINSHKDGIKVRPVWRPLHKSKYLKSMPRMKLKNTQILENRLINLPSSPDITNILN